MWLAYSSAFFFAVGLLHPYKGPPTLDLARVASASLDAVPISLLSLMVYPLPFAVYYWDKRLKDYYILYPFACILINAALFFLLGTHPSVGPIFENIARGIVVLLSSLVYPLCISQNAFVYFLTIIVAPWYTLIMPIPQWYIGRFLVSKALIPIMITRAIAAARAKDAYRSVFGFEYLEDPEVVWRPGPEEEEKERATSAQPALPGGCKAKIPIKGIER
ncbi:MAG: hypothetical protein ACP5KV_04710 [Candidatus Methanomethylicaceae archaeon]